MRGRRGQGQGRGLGFRVQGWQGKGHVLTRHSDRDSREGKGGSCFLSMVKFICVLVL